MIGNFNLKDALDKEKEAFGIDELTSILTKDSSIDQNNMDNINNSSCGFTSLDLDLIDANNIYTIEQIESLAVKYRLRFLPSKYYTGQIPQEALNKLRVITNQNSTPVEQYRILAPQKAFDLEDENADPLLFIALNKREYYFVHQWGNDLSNWRKIMTYPLRSLNNVIGSIIILGFILTLITPQSWILPSYEGPVLPYIDSYRFMYFAFVTAMITGFSIFIFASYRIMPSDFVWKKKTNI